MHGAHRSGGNPAGRSTSALGHGAWTIWTADRQRPTAPLLFPWPVGDRLCLGNQQTLSGNPVILHDMAHSPHRTKIPVCHFWILEPKVSDTSLAKMIHVHPSLPNSTHVYIYISFVSIYIYVYMDPMRLLLYGHLLATMAAIAPIEILMPSSVCHPLFQPSASALHRDLYSNGINHCTIWTHIESAAKKPHWMKVSSSVLCKQPQRGDPAIFQGLCPHHGTCGLSQFIVLAGMIVLIAARATQLSFPCVRPLGHALRVLTLILATG